MKSHNKGITYRKKIAEIVRLRNSVNGNARFEVRFADGTSVKTPVDSSLADDVKRYRVGDWLAFMVDGRGNFSHLHRI